MNPFLRSSAGFSLILLSLLSWAILGNGLVAQDNKPGPPEVMSIAYSPDGTMIAVSGGPFGCLPPGTVDRSLYAIRILDSRTKQPTENLEYHLCAVNSIAWNASGTQLASSGDDGIALVWDVPGGQIVAQAEGIFQRARSGILWNPNNDLLADFSPLGPGVRIWDSASGLTRALLREPGDRTPTAAIAWSPDGSRLAVANEAGHLQIWDVSTLESGGAGQMIANYTEMPAAALAWNGTSDRLALGGIDVQVIDPTNPQDKRTLVGHTNVVLSLSWNSDNVRLASGGMDGSVRIWDTSSGDEIEALNYHGVIRSVAWNPAGDELAYGGGSSDNIVTVHFPQTSTDP